MEGYLFKKGRGQSGFLGRKNWKKRWCVLEGQYLTYYEDFDKKTQKPTIKKGMVPVRGCTVEDINDKEKKFQFVLKHETRGTLYMSAEDDKFMKIWKTALLRAAALLHDGPVSIDFTEYYEIFGLNISDNPTISQVNRAYRKTCLKCHPDKGGDANEFKKVTEAYEILTAKFEEEEEEKLYKNIEYDAVIEKGPPGIGFGMVVAEDTKRQVVQCKSVMPTMNLKSITKESSGCIKSGDILIKIGDDEITGWTLTRIVQRLNDFRVPINTDIQLRFSRRVKIVDDELPEEVHTASYGDIDRDEPSVPRPPSEHHDEETQENEVPQQSEAPPMASSHYGDMHDIDEDPYHPSDSPNHPSYPPNPSSSDHGSVSKSASHGTFADIDDDIDENIYQSNDYGNEQHSFSDTHSKQGSEHSPKNNNNNNVNNTATTTNNNMDTFEEADDEQYIVAEGDWCDALNDADRRATIESASEDIQAEFQDMSNILKEVIIQRDLFKSQIIELKEIIKTQKLEKKSLLKQLEYAELDCESAEKKEASAILQIKELAYINQQSSEDIHQLTRNAANISSLLKRQQEIPVSRDFNLYLTRNGYTEQSTSMSAAINAQRTALRTAGALDKNGSVLRKWSLEVL